MNLCLSKNHRPYVEVGVNLVQMQVLEIPSTKNVTCIGRDGRILLIDVSTVQSYICHLCNGNEYGEKH